MSMKDDLTNHIGLLWGKSAALRLSFHALLHAMQHALE
jgi:hypothetical protein